MIYTSKQQKVKYSLYVCDMANHFEAYKTHLARPSKTNQFSFPHSGLLTLSGRTCVASRPPSFSFFGGHSDALTPRLSLEEEEQGGEIAEKPTAADLA